MWWPNAMCRNPVRRKRELIVDGVSEAIARALECHKRRGGSIAVWKDGRIVTLKLHPIPTHPTDRIAEVSAPFAARRSPFLQCASTAKGFSEAGTAHGSD